MKKIVCINGHDLYRIVTGIGIGDRVLATDLERIDDRLPPPKNGYKLVCPECGAVHAMFKDGRRRPVPIY